MIAHKADAHHNILMLGQALFRVMPRLIFTRFSDKDEKSPCRIIGRGYYHLEMISVY